MRFGLQVRGPLRAIQGQPSHPGRALKPSQPFARSEALKIRLHTSCSLQAFSNLIIAIYASLTLLIVIVVIIIMFAS